MEQENNKTEWLHLRLTSDEKSKIEKAYKKTTCRKLSDYARKILLGKPLIATYRDQSLDDLMAELIKLRGELNAIGNNFNQVVRKLHLHNQTGQLQSWVMRYEADNERLIQSVQNIEQHINKMADSWLR
ncbi:plasmid mobilization protein [Mucilaginibacter ginsenosidivorans]|uniref:MobC family plasmid mobilization relaxosome protein n=1 Tax=Mucilaginibacter ginsenosidivorans TaxID=398053 RepID=A0A5B8USB8_9SPHI|nr:MobC family plasmid mobilization relaxosome protein [Mucilaginibacter ginsenosidivorans]QEC61970.1 MobC family plasmid mobilization relaxosome protein [Mucilaginibacter ginsenosidivorans]